MCLGAAIGPAVAAAIRGGRIQASNVTRRVKDTRPGRDLSVCEKFQLRSAEAEASVLTRQCAISLPDHRLRRQIGLE